MSMNNDDQISVNRMSLLDVKKKIMNLIYSLEDNLSSVNKSLLFAEDSGWNDKSFYHFNAKFLEASQKIKEGLKICDDDLLPDIKKIESIFEEWRFFKKKVYNTIN